MKNELLFTPSHGCSWNLGLRSRKGQKEEANTHRLTAQWLTLELIEWRKEWRKEKSK